MKETDFLQQQYKKKIIILLGDELITNGGYDSDTNWTKSANWSIAGGVATSDGGSGSLEDSSFPSVTIGDKFMIDFEVTAYTSGSLTSGSNSIVEDDVVGIGIGRYKAIYTATKSSRFYWYSNSFDGSIDNVSIKKIIRN